MLSSFFTGHRGSRQPNIFAVTRVKALAAVTVAALFLAGATDAQAPSQAGPPTAEAFARAPAFDQVTLSPDGKHIAALTSPDGQTIQISVWETDALDKPAQVIAGNARIRYIGLGFLKNDRLLVTAIQTYTEGQYNGHLTKQYITDFSGKAFGSLMSASGSRSEYESYANAVGGDAEVLDRLPLDPQNVIVVDHRLNTEGDLYRLNVYSGATSRIARGSEKYDDLKTDLKGEVRARISVDFEGGKIYVAQWLKHPDTGEWQEHFRWYAKDREPVDILGFDTDPNIVFMRTSLNREKAAIFEYDIRARKVKDTLFEHRMFDAGGMIRSRAAADYGRPLGFTYQGERDNIYWTDDKLRADSASLRAALNLKTLTVDWVDPGTGDKAKISIPDGAGAQVISLSDDLKSEIIERSGPSQPPAYYLLRDGKLRPLGESRPWIDTSKLGRTTLVEYAARDGLMIPAYLTLPPASLGTGPFPALVLPHGGPWARDSLDWDVSGWTHYFAARGFAVLQPQFRGSEGWGQKLWRAGDGEWGGKMQDDKGDGAKWLIAQKIAAPDRIAMFGYSYGGYAALAAAIRPNGLYQCAISGAGAGDLASIAKATFSNRMQREFQNPTIGGLDALAHAREAKIPILIYHGDRDRTVELKQSRKFDAELNAAGLPHKFIEIKDMGHQFVTMTPAMVALQLTEIEKYLKTDCGPGGL
ncbi:S9 family peptidase [soil metagenome]